MTAKKIRSVLISGAGIAGPTLAFWLLRHGFEPVLVERSPRLREGGYMIDFWGIGYEVAERMGLLPRLREVGYDLSELRLVDSAGRRIGGFDGSAFRSALSGKFFSILRGDLARTIYARIDGRMETIFGDGVAEITQDENSVRVAFERAPPRSFDLVVGADGLHSAVRRAVFGPEERFEEYLGYCTASFTAPAYPHRDEGAYVSRTVPGHQLARYALRDGGSGFFFVFVRDHKLPLDQHEAPRQRAVLREAFGRTGWECAEILALLDRADDLYFDAVSQIRMHEWWRGRIVLVGDAAFSPSLLAGQGSAFAMAGAYILAGELARAEGDLEAAFRRYQSLFKPFIDAKQRAAKRLGGWFAPRTKVGLLLRNGATRLLSLPVVSDWMLRRMVADRFRLPNYPA